MQNINQFLVETVYSTFHHEGLLFGISYLYVDNFSRKEKLFEVLFICSMCIHEKQRIVLL